MTSIRSFWVCTLVLGGSIMAFGCYTAELDPEREGVFACEVDDDCADDTSCINGKCEQSAPPSLQIPNPEPEHPFTYDPTAETVDVTFTVRAANLNLRDPAQDSEHKFGEGHVRVVLDGGEVLTISSGPISAGISRTVTVVNNPGVHRLSARVFRNDGKPYDNEDALTNRLFWFNDGNPHVAFKTPWPNTEFSIVAQDPLLVEIETINFRLRDPSADPPEAKSGHAHINYDASLKGCPLTSFCDDGYLELVGSRSGCRNTVSNAGSCAIIQQGLPNSSEREARLSVSLRHHNHDPYFHPFVEDEGETDGEDEEPALVFDEIPISRVSAL